MMFDLIIIGSGVAGMSASVYASRYQINHLIFGEAPGGQGMLAGAVENYPGYVSIPGPELMAKFIEQVKNYDVEIKQEKVGGLAKIEGARLPSPGGEANGGQGFEVKTNKEKYQARTLILAMGASYRHLNIPGEEKLIGKGVSYCSTCDAPLFKEKTVAIIGGGNAALMGAIHAAEFAQKVFLIHRRDEYRAEPIRVEKLRQNKKIEEILSNEVKEIKGTEKVEGIVLKNPYNRFAKTPSSQDSDVGKARFQASSSMDSKAVESFGKKTPSPQDGEAYKGSQEIKVDGVFVEIGQVPSSTLAKQLGVELDERNYVKVNPGMATNIPGVFAAGDIAAIEGGLLFRQFVTAASDGARAAASAYQYLQGKAPTPSWGQKLT